MLGFVMVSMLLLGGVRLRWLLLLAAPVLAIAPVMYGHLKPYQQQRIMTFIDPDADPLGAGYHIIQSKIAVGSGCSRDAASCAAPRTT
jgi:rod shape determining protein RodA